MQKMREWKRQRDQEVVVEEETKDEANESQILAWSALLTMIWKQKPKQKQKQALLKIAKLD